MSPSSLGRATRLLVFLLSAVASQVALAAVRIDLYPVGHLVAEHLVPIQREVAAPFATASRLGAFGYINVTSSAFVPNGSPSTTTTVRTRALPGGVTVPQTVDRGTMSPFFDTSTAAPSEFRRSIIAEYAAATDAVAVAADTADLEWIGSLRLPAAGTHVHAAVRDTSSNIPLLGVEVEIAVAVPVGPAVARAALTSDKIASLQSGATQGQWMKICTTWQCLASDPTIVPTDWNTSLPIRPNTQNTNGTCYAAQETAYSAPQLPLLLRNRNFTDSDGVAHFPRLTALKGCLPRGAWLVAVLLAISGTASNMTSSGEAALANYVVATRLDVYATPESPKYLFVPSSTAAATVAAALQVTVLPSSTVSVGRVVLTGSGGQSYLAPFEQAPLYYVEATNKSTYRMLHSNNSSRAPAAWGRYVHRAMYQAQPVHVRLLMRLIGVAWRRGLVELAGATAGETTALLELQQDIETWYGSTLDVGLRASLDPSTPPLLRAALGSRLASRVAVAMLDSCGNPADGVALADRSLPASSARDPGGAVTFVAKQLMAANMSNASAYTPPVSTTASNVLACARVTSSSTVPDSASVLRSGMTSGAAMGRLRYFTAQSLLRLNASSDTDSEEKAAAARLMAVPTAAPAIGLVTGGSTPDAQLSEAEEAATAVVENAARAAACVLDWTVLAEAPPLEATATVASRDLGVQSSDGTTATTSPSEVLTNSSTTARRFRILLFSPDMMPEATLRILGLARAGLIALSGETTAALLDYVTRRAALEGGSDPTTATWVESGALAADDILDWAAADVVEFDLDVRTLSASGVLGAPTAAPTLTKAGATTFEETVAAADGSLQRILSTPLVDPTGLLVLEGSEVDNARGDILFNAQTASAHVADSEDNTIQTSPFARQFNSVAQSTSLADLLPTGNINQRASLSGLQMSEAVAVAAFAVAPSLLPDVAASIDPTASGVALSTCAASFEALLTRLSAGADEGRGWTWHGSTDGASGTIVPLHTAASIGGSATPIELYVGRSPPASVAWATRYDETLFGSAFASELDLQRVADGYTRFTATYPFAHPFFAPQTLRRTFSLRPTWAFSAKFAVDAASSAVQQLVATQSDMADFSDATVAIMLRSVEAQTRERMVQHSGIDTDELASRQVALHGVTDIATNLMLAAIVNDDNVATPRADASPGEAVTPPTSGKLIYSADTSFVGFDEIVTAVDSGVASVTTDVGYTRIAPQPFISVDPLWVRPAYNRRVLRRGVVDIPGWWSRTQFSNETVAAVRATSVAVFNVMRPLLENAAATSLNASFLFHAHSFMSPVTTVSSLVQDAATMSIDSPLDSVPAAAIAAGRGVTNVSLLPRALLRAMSDSIVQSDDGTLREVSALPLRCVSPAYASSLMAYSAFFSSAYVRVSPGQTSSLTGTSSFTFSGLVPPSIAPIDLLNRDMAVSFSYWLRPSYNASTVTVAPFVDQTAGARAVLQYISLVSLFARKMDNSIAPLTRYGSRTCSSDAFISFDAALHPLGIRVDALWTASGTSAVGVDYLASAVAAFKKKLDDNAVLANADESALNVVATPEATGAMIGNAIIIGVCFVVEGLLFALPAVFSKLTMLYARFLPPMVFVEKSCFQPVSSTSHQWPCAMLTLRAVRALHGGLALGIFGSVFVATSLAGTFALILMTLVLVLGYPGVMVLLLWRGRPAWWPLNLSWYPSEAAARAAFDAVVHGYELGDLRSIHLAERKRFKRHRRKLLGAESSSSGDDGKEDPLLDIDDDPIAGELRRKRKELERGGHYANFAEESIAHEMLKSERLALVEEMGVAAGANERPLWRMRLALAYALRDAVLGGVVHHGDARPFSLSQWAIGLQRFFLPAGSYIVQHDDQRRVSPCLERFTGHRRLFYMTIADTYIVFAVAASSQIHNCTYRMVALLGLNALRFVVTLLVMPYLTVADNLLQLVASILLVAAVAVDIKALPTAADRLYVAAMAVTTIANLLDAMMWLQSSDMLAAWVIYLRKRTSYALQRPWAILGLLGVLARQREATKAIAEERDDVYHTLLHDTRELRALLSYGTGCLPWNLSPRLRRRRRHGASFFADPATVPNKHLATTAADAKQRDDSDAESGVDDLELTVVAGTLGSPVLAGNDGADVDEVLLQLEAADEANAAAQREEVLRSMQQMVAARSPRTPLRFPAAWGDDGGAWNSTGAAATNAEPTAVDAAHQALMDFIGVQAAPHVTEQEFAERRARVIATTPDVRGAVPQAEDDPTSPYYNFQRPGLVLDPQTQRVRLATQADSAREAAAREERRQREGASAAVARQRKRGHTTVTSGGRVEVTDVMLKQILLRLTPSQRDELYHIRHFYQNAPSAVRAQMDAVMGMASPDLLIANGERLPPAEDPTATDTFSPTDPLAIEVGRQRFEREEQQRRKQAYLNRLHRDLLDKPLPNGLVSSDPAGVADALGLTVEIPDADDAGQASRGVTIIPTMGDGDGQEDAISRARRYLDHEGRLAGLDGRVEEVSAVALAQRAMQMMRRLPSTEAAQHLWVFVQTPLPQYTDWRRSAVERRSKAMSHLRGLFPASDLEHLDGMWRVESSSKRRRAFGEATTDGSQSDARSSVSSRQGQKRDVFVPEPLPEVSPYVRRAKRTGLLDEIRYDDGRSGSENSAPGAQHPGAVTQSGAGSNDHHIVGEDEEDAVDIERRRRRLGRLIAALPRKDKMALDPTLYIPPRYWVSAREHRRMEALETLHPTPGAARGTSYVSSVAIDPVTGHMERVFGSRSIKRVTDGPSNADGADFMGDGPVMVLVSPPGSTASPKADGPAKPPKFFTSGAALKRRPGARAPRASTVETADSNDDDTVSDLDSDDSMSSLLNGAFAALGEISPENLGSEVQRRLAQRQRRRRDARAAFFGLAAVGGEARDGNATEDEDLDAGNLPFAAAVAKRAVSQASRPSSRSSDNTSPLRVGITRQERAAITAAALANAEASADPTVSAWKSLGGAPSLPVADHMAALEFDMATDPVIPPTSARAMAPATPSRIITADVPTILTSDQTNALARRPRPSHLMPRSIPSYVPAVSVKRHLDAEPLST